LARRSSSKPGLPTPKQILDFIAASDQPAGKREIAREFGLRGQEKIALKALLKDMTDEGLVDLAPGRAFQKMGGVAKVTALRVVAIADDQAVAVPDIWEAQTPAPRVRILEQGRKGALGVGDRVLARTEERGKGYVAHVMKKLERTDDQVLGVVTLDKGEGGRPDRHWLRAVDKKSKRDWQVTDLGEAIPGDLVMAEVSGRPPKQSVRVTQVLGDPLAPKSYSEIAIHKYGIPHRFTANVLDEAEAVAKIALGDQREDLTSLPIVAIDPADARDHDDAIWAQPDDDAKNPGGFRAIVAIADVSYYVRPHSALDREARKRANSVYFPDQVVPMLPERLSADVCSLRQGEDRAAMACHLTIAADGTIKAWRFTRARVRLSANIAYEDAQAAIDTAGTKNSVGPEPVEGLSFSSSQRNKEEGQGFDKLSPNGDFISILQPLWDCWKLLKAARDRREPLDLDLPERRIELDETGRIASVAVRERLDAHRLVEDFMIAANVAAAKALEAKASPVMYRIHEVPSREKLVAMKDFLKTLDMNFALGQVIRPATFNRVLAGIDNDPIKAQVMEQVLRTQTQAYYGPGNMGHFGLALGSYAHFTSPIRRYADLLVHRALVDAYKLEQGKPADRDIPAHSGLAKGDAGEFDKIGQAISDAERRAMQAERETVDRYVAAYLSNKIGEIVETRITGVKDFGFFATVDGIGGDGLIPVRTLGREYFEYDEASQTLVGRDSGTTFKTGDRLPLRLVEADPIKASLLFELPDTDRGSADRGRAGGGPSARRPGGGDRGRSGKTGGGGQGKPYRGKGKPYQGKGAGKGRERDKASDKKGPHRKGPGKPPAGGKPSGKRGRPANIKHQGRKKPR